MELKLERSQFREDGIFGQLFDEKGAELAVTLEHAYPDGGDFWPKLPDGEYKCRRGTHKLPNAALPFETFEILGVPGHRGILFHVGNYNRDSDGCVLVGRYVIPIGNSQAISASRLVFEDFMDFLDGVNEFSLKVTSLS